MTHLSPHALAIVRAFESIEMSRDGGFWWCGERADWYPARYLAGLSAQERRALTLNALTDCIYENFYRCGGELSPLSPAGKDHPVSDPILRSQLAAANTGIGSWRPGWEVIGSDSRGRVRVRRDGLTLTAMPDEIRLIEAHEALTRWPANMYALSPGFHMANLDVPPDPGTVPVRLYWHVAAAGAEPFIHAVTRRCNEAGIGGSLKVLNDRSRYDRCDSAVVYLSIEDVSTHLDVISAIHVELTSHLLPETPAMTLRLAKGLAIAQDPGGGVSFGQHRSRLIAEAAIRRGDSPTVDGLRSSPLARVFAAEGISWQEPYCSQHASDAFAQLAGRWNTQATA